MKITQVSFLGQPNKYHKVDETISRSAQPSKDDYKWLQSQGVTDVVNFRHHTVNEFDERQVVNSLGMKYHHIPSSSKHPMSQNILKFLNLAEQVKQEGGKLHIHCMAGVDRTGLYSFAYKEFNNLDSTKDNVIEWIKIGLHIENYPDMISWALNFIKKYKK